MPTTHLFIKTWPRDYCWLEFCLASIRRNLTGHSGITILTDPGQLDSLERLVRAHLGDPGVPVHLDEFPNPTNVRGYMWQQVAKCHADEHCPPDTDFIACLDSDCVIRPGTDVSQWFADPDDRGLRAVWLFETYAKLGPSVPWQPVVESWLGEPVEHEFMRSHPFVIPAACLAHVRDHTLRRHHVPLAEYVDAQPGHHFTEFNCIGAWLYREVSLGAPWPAVFLDPPGPDRGVTQRWSWGGLNRHLIEQIRAEIGL